MRNLSKLMSLILRHEPERFGLVLDAEGFVPIDELLVAIRTRQPGVTREQVVAVVAQVEPEKQRFTIEGNDIRANYGHSFAQRIEHEPAPPPDLLYHGTHAGAVADILREGLRPMARQYVHLTTDREMARRVGARHGVPSVLRIDVARALAAGVVFYRANRTFWLVDGLPADCVARD
jgi:putative RNA 2'-phosphotransferase